MKTKTPLEAGSSHGSRSWTRTNDPLINSQRVRRCAEVSSTKQRPYCTHDRRERHLAAVALNPVRLFFTVPTDFWDKMTPNAAGWTTPCRNCTVSKVTSIAQSGAGCQQYCFDDSYFGIDINGDNAINWIQLAFGTWESECVSGASVCYFDTSNDPTVYAGAPSTTPTRAGRSRALVPMKHMMA